VNVENLVGVGPRERGTGTSGPKKFPSGREKRRFGRRKVFKRAAFEADDGVALPCIVVDVSQGGARIQFRDGVEVPGIFLLIIEEDDLCIACQVAHRKTNSCGVKFVGSPRRLSWLKRSNDDRLKQALSPHAIGE
jgi:PilZ domain